MPQTNKTSGLAKSQYFKHAAHQYVLWMSEVSDMHETVIENLNQSVPLRKLIPAIVDPRVTRQFGATKQSMRKSTNSECSDLSAYTRSLVWVSHLDLSFSQGHRFFSAANAGSGQAVTCQRLIGNLDDRTVVTVDFDRCYFRSPVAISY